MGKLNNSNLLTLNFNLREPYGNKATNIYAVIKINGKQIKIPLGMKINSWQWDKAKQIPLINSNVTLEDKENAIKVFNKIYEFRLEFTKYLAYICTVPTANAVKQHFINVINQHGMANTENLKAGNGRKPKATTLLTKAFEIYYKEMHKTIRQSSVKANKARLNAYRDYCSEKGKDALSMLTQAGLNEYQGYLLKKAKKDESKGAKRFDSPQSINNKCELIERLINRVMVGHSSFTRYKIAPVKYNQLEEVKQRGDDKKRRPLTDEEIQKLVDCDTLDEEEDEYRNLFLLECYASCRVGDMPKLFDKSEQKTIKRGDYEFIVINTQKENVISVIWVNDQIKPILERYRDGFKFVKLQSKGYATKYNEMIKVVAKKAQLDSPKRYRDAHNRIVEKPLYDVISSHFARYTFIYNGLYKYGFTPDELKDFTGHVNDRMINECYKVETAEDKANNAYKAINRMLNKSQETNGRIRVTRNNMNEQEDLIREVKDALFCLGADLNELADINDYHTLTEMLYVDYHDKYKKMGCNMSYIKELYQKGLSLKETRTLIEKVIEEVKSNKTDCLAREKE